MKQPAASPGRAEKQQHLPAPPGLARLLLSKSRRGARSRRAPATSPMFVSRGRSSRAPADGEPSSPKVTCIGQVRMRKGKGKNGKKGTAPAPARASAQEKARGYCRCLRKAFLCGGLFGFDRSGRKHKAPSPVAERTRRSPWVFSSRDVAVAAAPKAPDPRSERAEDEEEEDEEEMGVGVFCSVEPDEAEEEQGINADNKQEDEEEAELVSSATATPPKNALLLMRCRSAPQNRCSPLTARFAAAAASAPSPVQETADFAVEIASTASARASPSPRKPEMMAVEREATPPARPSSSPRKVAVEREEDEEWQEMVTSAAQEQQQEEVRAAEQVEEEDEYDEDEEAEELRCSSARPLVLPRCKSEPATTAAAKMASGIGADAASSGCFWAHGGSGRRRHPPPVSAAPVALAGH